MNMLWMKTDIRTPFFSADVFKKCALIALHLKAEEVRGRKSGCRTLDLEKDWELPRVALSCHIALDMLRPGWAVAAKRPFVTARKLLSHRGRVVTMKERDVVRKKSRRNVSDKPS